ncbi:MAG: thioesterase family protein [Caulobacterales bacterium]
MTELFDLTSTHNPHRYYLPVVREIWGGAPTTPFLFGGVGLAAAIKAMELTCKRPVTWATAQYLSFARPPAIVDLDIHVPINGRYTSQAQALLHIDAAEIITVTGALGERPGAPEMFWPSMPDAPAPEACSPAPRWSNEPPDQIDSQFDIRTAGWPTTLANPKPGGPANDGRTLLWAKPKGNLPIDKFMLAVIADFVSRGIEPALGVSAGGNSLDNTIRYSATDPTEWVLCDIRIEAVHSGVIHGAMHIYSQNGVLVATASQSLILRIHTDRPRVTP